MLLGNVPGAWGLVAHPEFRHPVCRLHGILHGRGHPEGLSPVVHGHYSGGFGHSASDDHVRLVRGHGARDPVPGRSLPPQRGPP